MASINKVILIGNLGQDPQTRYMPNGDPTCTVSIATTRQWKDKNGEKQESTEWHRVTFFRGLAKIVQEYLLTGSQVYIEGYLKTRKWTDKNGVERYTTEIVADDMKMLGRKQSGASAPAAPAPAPAHAPQRGKMEDFEDDVPF